MFLNIYDYASYRYPFQIFIGGRGSGKTYSAWKGVLNLEEKKTDKKFIWMRRTRNELDLMLDTDKGEGVSDLKVINRDFNTNLGFRKINNNVAGVYHRRENEQGKLEHYGEPIGYGLSLSTVASIRGMNFSDCSDWVYDEFIPEKHVKKLKNECDALLNAYETINRNREFNGEKPIRLWLLANSNDIYNPIFTGLGIVSLCEKMLNRHSEHYYDKSRGLAIHILEPNPDFIKKKKQTALYRLTSDTAFGDMALKNEFAFNDFSLIGHQKLQGYYPVCRLDDAYIWMEKSKQKIYVSYAPAKVPFYNVNHEQEIKRFQMDWGNIIYPYVINGKILFESYDLKQKVLTLIF